MTFSKKTGTAEQVPVFRNEKSRKLF